MMLAVDRVQIIIAASLLLAAGTALARHNYDESLDALICKRPDMCLANKSGGGCVRYTLGTNLCIPGRYFGGGNDVMLSCGNKDSALCVNATGFGADSTCTSPTASLNCPCSTCMAGQMRFDCGGLGPGSMFVLSQCQDQCNTCNSTIVGFGQCRKIPGIGYAKVNGLSRCTSVKVMEFSPRGSYCLSAPVRVYSLWNGQCFEGKRLTCLSNKGR